jgi:hypothetical protein
MSALAGIWGEALRLLRVGERAVVAGSDMAALRERLATAGVG